MNQQHERESAPAVLENRHQRDADLPRLVYFGDVPVEATYYGSLLLYRLFEGYPPARLRILESRFARSQPSRRLPAIDYIEWPSGWPLLMRRYIRHHYLAWRTATASYRSSAWNAVEAFQPQAVLTVTHGDAWMTAARLAEERRLPLHLILHDDWAEISRLPAYVRPVTERALGRVWKQAASRLCVSPRLCEEYGARYGTAAGTVLYPSRARHCPSYDSPPERLRDQDGSPVFAFAGTINSPGYEEALTMVADSVGDAGCRLLVFGPFTPEAAARIGRGQASIEFRGAIRSEEVIETLRNEADVLVVPMSFADYERNNTRLNFPSKLTDYTATGLPLLIFAPGDSSAVQWANANPGVALCVDRKEAGLLADAVRTLRENASLRWSLGLEALCTGRRQFSYDSGLQVLYAALRRR